MADYAITGKKGSGKTLYAVGLIRDTLRQGRRVATNLNVSLDALLSHHNKSTYIRLPDRPSVKDFEALGRGQPGVVEDDNGIIVLDESSTFFGARQFQDKSRQPMLDWLIHSRKYGWDVYYIMQGVSQVDKLIRDTQIEYHIAVSRTDKWPIPVVTPVCKQFGLTVRFPKFHFGTVRHGVDSNALKIDRHWYRGRDIYPAYQTQQIFLDRDHPDAVGLHTVLSAFHLKGRYMSWWERTRPVIAAGVMMGAAIGLALGGYAGYSWSESRYAKTEKLEVDSDSKLTGYIQKPEGFYALFSDGRLLPADGKLHQEGIDYLLVSGKWIKQ